ncbi:MAG TPA: hypothetical protein VN737_08030 [Bryobacteraceae bacterium]|nr:hypothetical protein [Bryobacteraceae bacterium]
MKRSATVLALIAGLACGCSAATFRTDGADDHAWQKILGAIGIGESSGPEADILIAGPESKADLYATAENHIVIVEGAGSAAQRLGISPKAEAISVRQICDIHDPNMQIVWEQAADIPAVSLPDGFEVFASEKWKGIPVLAGKRTGHGAILWIATSPGASGFERYPYLLHALVDLGLPVPAQATGIWAFFDSSYRIRADVDYLARRWRSAGIGVLHVAAWHNVEPDPVQDEFLKRLIAACHRNAILVYAWVELPHVSEKFWADHPEWREKTAVGQDAQLDWRKLMNLQNPDCRKAVASQIQALLQRFDWDGVNVAELYFESLEGASNPARFTPMNDDVRREFKQIGGFDPKLLFEAGSPYAAETHPQALRKFLDYRAVLATRMQAEWLDVIDRSKANKPYLDVVLTHIDDRFEPGIRDALGADVAKSLPLMRAHKSTLLVEDPATLWNLGPERYAKLAEKYRELTPDRSQIAIDINVVERYQDVYPTKKQTGVELFELVHQAAVSFSRVALYFENSIEKQDLKLLPAAASTATVRASGIDALDVEASEPTRIAWQGPVELDGKPWPLESRSFVLAPCGKHRLTPGIGIPAVSISDFNGHVQSAITTKDSVDLAYSSRSRAIAVLASPVSSIELDGQPFPASSSVLLPAGQHLVSFKR